MNDLRRPGGFDSIADRRALLEGLFEHSPVAYQIYRADGRCLLVNPSFYRLFGPAPPPDYDVFHDEFLAKKGFLDHLRRAFAGATITVPAPWYPRELREVEVLEGRRAGIEVTLFPLRDTSGNVGHVALCFKEVTAEVHHEQALQALVRSEGRFRRLADAGIIGIAIADTRGEILEANDAFLETVGYTREEVLSGQVRWADMTPVEWREPDQQALEQLRATGVATAREKQYIRKDGRRVPVLVGGAMLEGTSEECIAFILELTSLKRAEEALQRSEKRFRRLAESGIIGIVSSDTAGHIKEANDAFLQIVGYTRDDLRAGRVSGKTLNTPERERTDAGAILELRSHGMAHPWEKELVRKDGSRVSVLNGVVMLDANSDDSVAFVLDLTERRRAEAAARDSNARKSAVMEAALDAVVIMDHAGVILEFNPAAERTFGYPAAEAIGMPLGDLLIPPSLRERHKEGLRRYLASGEGAILGKRIEVPALKRDGTEFPAEVAVVRIQSLGAPMFTGYIRDITDRRQAAEAEILRREITAAEAANSLLSAVIEGTSDAVYVKDLEGRFLLMNSAGATLAGARPVDMLGQRTAAFLPEHQAARISEEARLVMIDGVPRTYENTVSMEGEKRTFLVTNGPRRDSHGKITGLIGIAREITERKRAESELRRSKEDLELANRELETFSYSVAHDLRSPLRAIGGFSSILAIDFADRLDEEAKYYLHRITSGVARMSQIVDALLSLARLARTEPHREAVDLTQLAHAVVDQLRANDPTRSVQLMAAEGVVGQGEPQLLRALLENLIGNAWKFTSKRSEARIEFGCEKLNGVPTYFVRDNGAGFDMALVGKIFAPFQRLHAASEFEGTGIGLATVQRIVHRHGGRVWAESFANEGAVFRFTLYEEAPAERGS